MTVGTVHLACIRETKYNKPDSVHERVLDAPPRARQHRV